MSKLNLKCTGVLVKNSAFVEDRLYTGKVDDEGNVSVRVVKGAKSIILSVGISGEIFLSQDGQLIATFLSIRTKTIKCTYVDHRMTNKKTFKPGKRYMIEDGRACGAVAGYVFDEDGDRFNLYREDVGFSAAGMYLFEAKYS